MYIPGSSAKGRGKHLSHSRDEPEGQRAGANKVQHRQCSESVDEQSGQYRHEVPTKLSDNLLETRDLHQLRGDQEEHSHRWHPAQYKDIPLANHEN